MEGFSSFSNNHGIDNVLEEQSSIDAKAARCTLSRLGPERSTRPFCFRRNDPRKRPLRMWFHVPGFAPDDLGVMRFIIELQNLIAHRL
jgi:hypothetical protein